jgi:hypothetical protein
LNAFVRKKEKQNLSFVKRNLSYSSPKICQTATFFSTLFELFSRIFGQFAARQEEGVYVFLHSRTLSILAEPWTHFMNLSPAGQSFHLDFLQGTLAFLELQSLL